MIFEWDESKNEGNKEKHGLYLWEAELVFDDPAAVTLIDDRKDYGESRCVAIGGIDSVLFVVYTRRKDSIRVISLRKASVKERNLYHGNSKNDG